MTRIDPAPCPLCATIAARSDVPGDDGYLYNCVACAGFYEIGTGAQSRADSGRMHPGVIQHVRWMLAEGRRPRVEWNGPNGRFEVKAV
nr:hypothetical protein [uncultured Cupriavidus sp.]